MEKIPHQFAICFVAAILNFFFLSKQTFALERPSLKNLKAHVNTDYDLISYDLKNSADNQLYNWQIKGNYNSTGRPYSAFVAIFPPSRFSFYPSVPEGCKALVKTSYSSSHSYDCEYATNGAFFNFDNSSTGSYCIGNLVSDGKVWQLPNDGTGNNRANLGLTYNKQIISGFIDSNVISTSNFTQLITGWGWLVRGGVSNVQNSQDLSFETGGFTLEKAPRTAIGAFKNGTMLLLEIDGEEDIFAGPDLFETAELLVALGVHSAVNIDGGGSSVSVKNGQVIDLPTCVDTPLICERAVANVACVRR